ncbi:MAG: electron transport complex subunit RsxD [Gammaproteobacteria bacterium]|nr:electron transport complex subunit RsxD [Gammaproteobacteria bacterium]
MPGFAPDSEPHSVSSIMRQVLYALVPGIALYVWFFGFGIVINCLLATSVALVSEGIMLRLRKRPVTPFLTDGSAVVTAVLLALAMPPYAPWWVTSIAAIFAIVIAKHLYGGLGYNPFNPAMAGYALVLISFPAEMTTWPLPHMLSEMRPGFIDSAMIIFADQPTGALKLDALTGATPLAHVKSELGNMRMVSEAVGAPIFGMLGGKGWEWLSLGYLLGGVWLLYKKIIKWQIPVSMLAGLFIMAVVFYLSDPEIYLSPVFHLFSGATMLGAFFIATDPVTAATTPLGRIIFGAGIGILTYVIRAWAAYPDGLAFAVLLMNAAAPTIDHYTQPRILGEGRQ